MADEAILRIVLQDQGGGAPPPAAGPSASPSQSGPTPTPQVGRPNQPPPAQQRTASRVAPRADKPPEAKGPYDDIFKIVDALRGTIGGQFGPMVGALVDLASALTKNTDAAHGVKDAMMKPPPPAEEVTTAVPPMSPPPVEPGNVRLYHGGNATDTGGGRWVTQDQKYAEGYARKSGGQVHYADLPENHPLIQANKAFDDTGTSTKSPIGNFELPEDLAKQLKPLNPPQPTTAQPPPAAESAGGGMGALGEAGPIGAIIAAAVAVDNAIKSAIKTTISTVGSTVADLMTADGSIEKPIASFGDAVSKAGEHMGPFSYAVIAAGESLKALSVVMQAIDQTVARYGEYSPVIAQAQAISEVRTTLGDLHRAQQVGPDLARYVQAQTDLQQKYEDVKARLMEKIVPGVTRILEMLEVIMASVDNTIKGYDMIAKPLNDAADSIRKFLHLKEEEMHPPPDDPTSILIRGEVEVPQE